MTAVDVYQLAERLWARAGTELQRNIGDTWQEERLHALAALLEDGMQQRTLQADEAAAAIDAARRKVFGRTSRYLLPALQEYREKHLAA